VLLLPDVLVSPLAPIVLLLSVLPVPEAPMLVLPLLDVSLAAVPPEAPLVVLGVLLLVLGDALGVVVALLPALGVFVVMPPSEPELELPVAPDAPDEPLAPAAPEPPELCAIDNPPIARAAAAASAVRVFLVVIMS
jgi:hypothetical protein